MQWDKSQHMSLKHKIEKAKSELTELNRQVKQKEKELDDLEELREPSLPELMRSPETFCSAEVVESVKGVFVGEPIKKNVLVIAPFPGYYLNQDFKDLMCKYFECITEEDFDYSKFEG